MGSNVSCSLQIKISNNTQNITLRNPRTYFDGGHYAHVSLPELAPGSCEIRHFPDSSSLSRVSGILVYEADSFTLAIYFSNSIDQKLSTELGLELSPGKAHLGRLVDTYARMANGTYSSSDPDIKFHRIIVNKSCGTVQVSQGPVKVTATMSRATDSLLRVVLEEQHG